MVYFQEQTIDIRTDSSGSAESVCARTHANEYDSLLIQSYRGWAQLG